ncbi:Polyketide cyclase / dehydrase and lipid transport [Quadrisphaera granulorum]|uniref:Polyketide cyclase/dehydrase/lipid transport protein n=1 Tax=Quadrisphaera granulorum TaxID=317664 RepID=A0A316A2E1_9ACTN|nr:SRPBCC family protein [Quadrisphaera granulorum]PWJ51815.1 polyketide cyclase/dehydrase/lipid transport protein [Quadrisphaera granulorum]SZE97762.1 Polyketide cyclase / dehydrase and lipid transport [Quadrisphaera granulorum]
MAIAQTYTVERQVLVAAPPERIFAEIADLRRWQGWSPWEGLDPALDRTYSGPGSGEGAAYAWSGNRKAGKGSMRVARAEAPRVVSIDIAFEKPFPNTSTSTFTLTPEDDDGGAPATRVTWTMVGPRPLVMRLLGPALSMDKIVGKDFERGLQQLRAVSEAPPA